MGLSRTINSPCVMLAASLIISRTLRKKAVTFFRDGVMKSLPFFLRTVQPRKSKPSSSRIIRVFSADRDKPRCARNSTISAFATSSTSGEEPVTTKSSA